jgi:hypothetical protein
MGAFEIKPLTLDQSIRMYRTGFADPLVRPDNINAASSGTGVTSGSTGSIIAKYDDGEGRLTSFVHPDPDTDDSRLAYITLVNPNNAKFDDVDDKVSPVDRSVLSDLFAQLSGKYDKFIIEGMNTVRQEKAQIVSTLGDNYAALFSGKQPITIGVSGRLVCDYDKKALSWYKAFVYAYEYFLRASRLAKFRVKVRLVFPDVNEFEGYILSSSESQNSGDDMMIPWNFTMLATSLNPFKPYIASGSTGVTSVAQKTQIPSANIVDPNKLLSADKLTAPGAVPLDFGRTFLPSVSQMDVSGISTAFTNAQNNILAKASVAFKSFPDVAKGLSLSPADIGGIVNQNFFASSAQAWYTNQAPVVNEVVDKVTSVGDYVYKDISKRMQSTDIKDSVTKLNRVVNANMAAPGLISVATQDMFGKRKEYRNGGSLW